MSDAVLADAQFSAVRIFKPFQGFELTYQDVPVSVPIAIPGTLDPQAGKSGFDPNLLAGIPVPMGSKMIVWIPSIFNINSPSGLLVQPYKYRFIWRMRNISDFRRSRAAYHFPRQSPGTNGQFVVPSASKVAIYESVAQNFTTGIEAPLSSQFNSYFEGRQNSFSESIACQSVVPSPPLTSAGNPGAYQQGLAAAAAGSNLTVTFNSIQMDVEGDELIVLVDRNYNLVDEERNWDFTGGNKDSGFSAFFGTADGTRDPIRDMGIYIMTGSNP